VDIEQVEEGTLLSDLEVRTDHDTVLAYQRMKQSARLLGFRGQMQTQIAAAGSEIVRNALNHAGGCRTRLYVGEQEGSQMFCIVVRDNGPGLTEKAVSEGGGITTVVKLMDVFQIDSEPGPGTAVVLGKRLTGSRLSEREIITVIEKVSSIKPRSALKEVHEQNWELIVTLDALRRVRDREALRAREWQATFDAIPDALCVLDESCTLLQTNHAMRAFLDRKEAELQGKPWKDVDPFDGPDEPIAKVLEQARTSRCRASADLKLHHCWYRIQVDPLIDEEGRPLRFVLLITDITEEKRATERLTQINEALRTYAHSISHDIKGPLAGVATANQVLQQLLERPITDKSKASLRGLGDVLSTSINKVLTLINEVLALAETGAGPGGATYVRRVIDHVLQDRQKLIEQRCIKVELDSELGQVMAAPAHLYQVFANLVDNAIGHSTGLDVTISVRRLETPEEGVHRFLFRDNGPGIPEGLQDRVFDSFVRGDTAGEGSGIGLATVKRVVATYSGTIRAYNDGGACFELEIRDAVA